MPSRSDEMYPWAGDPRLVAPLTHEERLFAAGWFRERGLDALADGVLEPEEGLWPFEMEGEI